MLRPLPLPRSCSIRLVGQMMDALQGRRRGDFQQPIGQIMHLLLCLSLVNFTTAACMCCNIYTWWPRLVKVTSSQTQLRSNPQRGVQDRGVIRESRKIIHRDSGTSAAGQHNYSCWGHCCFPRFSLFNKAMCNQSLKRENPNKLGSRERGG